MLNSSIRTRILILSQFINLEMIHLIYSKIYKILDLFNYYRRKSLEIVSKINQINNLNNNTINNYQSNTIDN